MLFQFIRLYFFGGGKKSQYLPLAGKGVTMGTLTHFFQGGPFFSENSTSMY